MALCSVVSKDTMILASTQENLSSRGLQTNNNSADQPAQLVQSDQRLLFADRKVSYIYLLQAKFQFSSFLFELILYVPSTIFQL